MTRALNQLVIPALSAALLASCTTHGGNTFLLATKVIAATGTLDPLTKLITGCKLDPGAKELAFPAFDTTNALALGIVLENRLAATATVTKPESNDFVAEKFVVNYESTGTGSVSISEQSLPAQGYVTAGGIGVAVGLLMPVSVETALTGLSSVRIHVYVVGKLSDGTTVKSSDYEFIAVPGGPNCATAVPLCITCFGG